MIPTRKYEKRRILEGLGWIQAKEDTRGHYVLVVAETQKNDWWLDLREDHIYHPKVIWFLGLIYRGTRSCFRVPMYTEVNFKAGLR